MVIIKELLHWRLFQQNKMKKLFVFICIICLFNLFSLYAFDRQSNLLLTALKRGGTPLDPDPVVELSVFDASSTMVSGNALNVPFEARNNFTPAFSWVLAGNVFGQVELRFTIQSMKYTDIDSTNYFIPFMMRFSAAETKVGNFTIPYNSNTPLASNSFYADIGADTYKYDYSDKITRFGTVDNPSTIADARTLYGWKVGVSGDSTIDLSHSQSVSIIYNMSTKSTVQKNGVPATAAQYPELCNHWTRSGSAVVSIGIDEKGKLLDYKNGQFVTLPNTIRAEKGRYETSVTVDLIYN